MKKPTLSDAYYRGGFWGAVVGGSVNALLSAKDGEWAVSLSVLISSVLLYMFFAWKFYK